MAPADRCRLSKTLYQVTKAMAPFYGKKLQPIVEDEHVRQRCRRQSTGGSTGGSRAFCEVCICCKQDASEQVFSLMFVQPTVFASKRRPAMLCSSCFATSGLFWRMMQARAPAKPVARKCYSYPVAPMLQGGQNVGAVCMKGRLLEGISPLVDNG